MKQLFKLHENDLHEMINHITQEILKEEFGIINKQKSLVKLTENDLHKIIERSANKILKEDFNLYK